jgi:hypothetical protein
MGHSRKRVITGETPAGVGATYIVVEQFEDTVNIQTEAVGTVTTLTIDWTNQNILYDAAALAAVNVNTPDDPGRYSDPASATWVNIASAVGASQLQFPVFAIRIDITAGTGSVRYQITQG